MSETKRDERSLAHALEPRIAALVTGVSATIVTEDTPIPHLEGTDNGLYARLCQLAVSLGEIVADDDRLTGDILKDEDDARGLRREMYAGMTNFVKQGSPLEMTATLVHEHGHRYTDDVFDWEAHVLSETIADGSAFVVRDYFGLDISARSFPYLARKNSGIFTPAMSDGILVASTDMIERLQAQAS